MNVDKFGIPSYTPQEITTALYRGFFDLKSITVDKQYTDIDKFNLESPYDISVHQESTQTIEDFDKNYQAQWFIPNEYQQLDIIDHIISLCPGNDDAMLRVATELALFQQHNMLNLLNWVKYFVDTCRENKVLWGLGRGSSVASYVLFLMGLHKVDSLKYDLDIKEFFKEI